MKPSNGGSSSKSKKSKKKSRSKTSKSSTSTSNTPSTSTQASLTPLSTTVPTTSTNTVTSNNVSQENSSNALPQDSQRKKHAKRGVAGFGPSTIKMIWEQHNTSDIEILPDVFYSLAESSTYKVWELVNNAKTYARHSGGRLTVDLINEVLKDSDVPPIIGASDTEWNKVEFDGESVFFNSDHTHELRTEYFREIPPKRILNTDIIKSRNINRVEFPKLLKFACILTNVLFLGNEECFSFARHIAAGSPHIGSLLKILLKKITDIIVMNQNFRTTERCLKFLNSISINQSARDVECNQQLFHLAEALMNSLTGTMETVMWHAKYIISIKQRQKQEKEKKEKLQKKKEEEDRERIRQQCKEIEGEIIEDYIKSSDQVQRKGETNLNEMDIEYIRNEYEELINMIGSDDFQEQSTADNEMQVDVNSTDSRKSSNVNYVSNDKTKVNSVQETPINSAANPIASTSKEGNFVRPNEVITGREKSNPNKNSQTKDKQNMKSFNTHFQIKLNPLKQADLIAETIGHLSTQFSYFRNECLYLLVKRLEILFNQRNIVFEEDFDHISRCVKGLIAIGEHAFREILPFLHKIDPTTAPEWICNDFSTAAIFLKGNEDKYLYEWLILLCGYKLQPFNIYSHKYHQYLTEKFYKSLPPPTFIIKPKIILKLYNKKQIQKFAKLQDYFPNLILAKKKPRIIFKSVNCKQIATHKKVSESGKSQQVINVFNKKIVIAKRKLMKTLSNRENTKFSMNYCFVQI